MNLRSKKSARKTRIRKIWVKPWLKRRAYDSAFHGIFAE